MFLRFATTLPVVSTFNAHAPFQQQSGYAWSESKGNAASAFEEGLTHLRTHFSRGVTAGFSRLAVPKAVFFDMDATVIAEESLVELAAFAGLGDPVARITERAMAGELDFAAALRERVALLKGLDESYCATVAKNLTLNPGIEDLLRHCQQRGVKTFLVSGGFTRMAKVVQDKLGFDGIHANELGVERGQLNGMLHGEIVDGLGKLRYVQAICAQQAWSLQDVAAVGDGANDKPMLEAVGVAVGHQAKPVLFPVIHALNAAGDHRYLKALLFGTV